MQWKLILAGLAATALIISHYNTVTTERDRLASQLAEEKLKTNQLRNDLADQALIIRSQKSQINSITRANGLAVERLRTLENQHANAVQKLQLLEAEIPEQSEWSAAAVPDSTERWLRDLNTGTNGDNKAGNDSATTTSRRSD